MAEATTHTRSFRVVLDQVDVHEGYYELAGRRHGPFVSPEAAEAHLLTVLRRWRDRAAQLGGHLVRRAPLEIVVTLPVDVPFEGGEALEPWVRRRP